MLVTEEQEDAKRLIRDYPWLQEIYEEIAMLRRRPGELQKQLEEKDAEKAAVIREKDAEIAELKRQLEAIRPG